MPEYGVRFEFQNQSLFIFNGAKILHGVTPIHRVKPKGYRYSVVYYSLKGMSQCGSAEEEIEFLKKSKTKAAINRLDRMKNDPEKLKVARAKLEAQRLKATALKKKAEAL